MPGNFIIAPHLTFKVILSICNGNKTSNILINVSCRWPVSIYLTQFRLVFE